MGDIKIEDHGPRGRYVLEQGGLEAELTFMRRPDGTMFIGHTGVPPALGGQGIGGKLVARAAADARAAGFKIEPACSFAAAWFDRNPDWRDVLKR